MNILITIFLAIALAGCASTPTKTPKTSISTEKAVSTSSAGESFETAIEFPNAKSSMDGVPMEYQWLSKHYPNSKKVRQAIVRNGKDIYDALVIKTPEGNEKTIYFKMTNWFGMRR